MKYSFSELVDVDKIQNLTDLFYQATGIPSSVIGLDGAIITGSGWQPICTDFHRKNPETRKRCIECDTVIANRIESGRKYTVYRCSNGLIDAATPIFIEGEHAANLFTGQFLFESPDLDFFREQARRFGFDEDEYVGAAARIPVIDEAKLEPFLDFLVSLAEMMGDMGIRQIRQREIEKDLRESREDLNRAQAVAHTGSWRLDVHKDELLWSDENYRIFGIPQGTPLTYETFLNTVHPDDREYVDLKWTAAMHGEPYDIDHRIVVGGTIKWVRERAELEFDSEGKLLGGFGTSQDTTEKKQAEEEILKLNTELEQRVRDRTAKLENANRELESFSYSVSHDLRAPLRAIQGFSRILEGEYAGSLDDDGKRVISIIVDNTVRMNTLIDDLLAFSRVGRYDMKCKAVDMEGIARAVLDEVVPPQDARRTTVIVHPLLKAYGDESLIRQVWTNLLSNALKFSSRKETPQIEVGSKPSDGFILYYVKDNGVGFDMAYADKLFGVFQRLHTIEGFEGTGVGLAIAKRIISRHGGRIWAESSPGEGATFSFTLPPCRAEGK